MLKVLKPFIDSGKQSYIGEKIDESKFSPETIKRWKKNDWITENKVKDKPKDKE